MNNERPNLIEDGYMKEAFEQPQAVEMKPRVEYSPMLRVQEAWRQRRFMRRIGKDGRR